MDPDQTAHNEQSDLGPYCLQYRLPKYMSRRWQKGGYVGLDVVKRKMVINFTDRRKASLKYQWKK